MKTLTHDQRVVVTGLGVVSSTGIGKDAYYRQLQAGQSGVRIKDSFTEEGLDKVFFHACPDFNIKDYYQKIRAPHPMRYSQLAMLGCQLALQDAGLEEAGIPDNRIGMVLNTTFAANEAVEAYLLKLFKSGPSKASPFKFTRTVSNTALGDVTLAQKFRGVSSLVLGESSVCYGFDLLKKGEADVIFCGGFDEIRDVLFLSYEDNDLLLPCPQPNGISDSQALINSLKANTRKNKTVLGEASAFLVLETLEHARQRGAKPYAEILEYSISFDRTFEHFVFERCADDMRYVMTDALQRAGLDYTQVDAVIGASGLPWQYNEYEGKAIGQLWGDRPVAYTTIKSLIGETFGASSQTSLAAAALMMQHQEIFGHGLPEELFDHTLSQAQLNQQTVKVHELNHLLVNTIHASGNTSTFVLKALG